MKEIEELQTFLMSEQPTTCVICGARVEEIQVVCLNPISLHVKCLDINCGYEFISDSDNDLV